MDESGFNANSYRSHGWSKRGKKIHGTRCGKRSVRTNLIAAKCGRRLLAPLLYSGNTTAELVNQWVEEQLIPHLPPQSVLIMDNARFHQEKVLRPLLTKKGHELLFLPPYSPDLNPIEKVFANLKKRRCYATKNTSIDTVTSVLYKPIPYYLHRRLLFFNLVSG